MSRTKTTLTFVCALFCLFGLAALASAAPASPWQEGASEQAEVETASVAVEPAPEAEISQSGLATALGLESSWLDDGVARQNAGVMECALDFACTMHCQAIQHACILSCGGNTACQHACIAAGEQCAYANCCL